MAINTIILDAGHMGNISGLDGGAYGSGYCEATEVLNQTLEIGKILERHGLRVLYTRKSAIRNELSDKVNTEHNAGGNTNERLFISFHLNAFNGSAYGTEVFAIQGGVGNQLANILLSATVNTLGTTNRGFKNGSNLYVIRNTYCPACLVETCFIDNRNDMNKYKSKFNELCLNQAKAILSFVGITYQEPVQKPTPTVDSNTYFRVICGSYGVKNNAIEQQNIVKSKTGLDTFLAFYEDKQVYRVVCGSFQNRSEAEQRQSFLNSKGIDNFLLAFKK